MRTQSCYLEVPIHEVELKDSQIEAEAYSFKKNSNTHVYRLPCIFAISSVTEKAQCALLPTDLTEIKCGQTRGYIKANGKITHPPPVLHPVASSLP